MAAAATSAQKQTRITGDIERGWAGFHPSSTLKEREGNDGGFGGNSGTSHLLWEVSEDTVILVPGVGASPSPQPPACRQLFGA